MVAKASPACAPLEFALPFSKLVNEDEMALGLNVCVRFELPYVIARPSEIANGLGHKCCCCALCICALSFSFWLLLLFMVLNEDSLEFVVNAVGGGGGGGKNAEV